MTTTTPERKAKQPTTHESRNGAHTSDPNGAIARRAFELYEQRGREPGGDVDDWLRAEHEVQGSQSQNS
jgi:Protein of unknown function (DUF2934)